MLLSEGELRAAIEPLLERILTERLRLFQLQLEPRLQAMITAAAQPSDTDTTWGEGLRRLARPQAANACFAELFELTGAVVGRTRALLVERRGEMAVWRQEGTALPGRFATASRRAWLREGSTALIEVRGHSVGALYWPGGALEKTAAARIALLTQVAGLALLAGVLQTHPASSVATTAQNQAPQERPTREGRAARNDTEAQAQRFARLLIEDLALYLGRERRQEVEMAQARGDWRERFTPELARCRRAFLERYPAGGEISIETFEEETSRLIEA